MHVPGIGARLYAAGLFSLLVAFNNASAQAMPGAREFLEAVVKADFEGDALPRIGHVARKPGPRDPNEDSGPSFEVYMLDSDPLVVVSDWRFAGIARGSGAACGTFRFTVLARTAGEGPPSWMSTKARRIRAVKRRQEDVAYCAKFVDGRWMLIDPPLPRVSKTVLLDALGKSEAQVSGNAAHPGSRDPRAVTTVRRVLESLRGQIAVLSALE